MESTPQQTAEGKAVVTVIAAVLERLVKSNVNPTASNNKPSGSNPEVTKFHALKAPGISIKQYLERIHKYASCTTECFILALIYIDRLIENNNFILSELNAHRVIITAILLAAKFFDDAYYNNAYYAKVGGVLVSEMNGLEVEFLFRINFSLHVKPEIFAKYQDELVSHAVGAGLDHQQQLQLQKKSNLQLTPEEQSPQQLNVAPVQNLPGVPLTVNPQVQCGNVTPSPPQMMDASQQQQQHHPIQDMHFHRHTNQQYMPSQPQLQAVQPSIQTRDYYREQQKQHDPIQKSTNYSLQYEPQNQQPTELPSKNYQMQNNTDIRIHIARDPLYVPCVPYGGLNQNSSSQGLFATKIYQ